MKHNGVIMKIREVVQRDNDADYAAAKPEPDQL